MAFANRLTEKDLSLRFYIRFRGIPYIFANFAIPTAWDAGGGTVTISGETYTWNTSLISESVQGVTTRVNPKLGIASAGRQRFRFLITGTQTASTGDAWLTITPSDIRRSDLARATITSDFDQNDATMPVDSTSEYGSSGTQILYSGLETMTTNLAAKTGTTFTSVGRGKYGSQAIYHEGVISNIDGRGAGAWVTSSPFAWEGRPVSLWMATGYGVASFTPYGSTIMSSEDSEVWAGLVSDLSVSKDLAEISLNCVSLDQLLRRTIGTRIARAWCSHIPSRNGLPSNTPIAIDEHSNKIQIGLAKVASGAGYSSVAYSTLDTLQLDGSDIPDGLYHPQTVCRSIAETLTASSRLLGTEFDCYLQDTGEGHWQVRLSALLPSGTSTQFAVQLIMNVDGVDDANSIWHELGFTSNTGWVESWNAGSDRSQTWRVDAGEPIRLFHYPDHGTRRLYYTDQKTTARGDSITPTRTRQNRHSTSHLRGSTTQARQATGMCCSKVKSCVSPGLARIRSMVLRRRTT
jgi:hypothetical protein